jgi:hypothetical protein
VTEREKSKFLVEGPQALPACPSSNDRMSEDVMVVRSRCLRQREEF